MSLPSLSTTVPGLTAFDRAVHVVNISYMTSQSPTGTADSDKVSFSPEDQLLLYGAYKQATKGDVKGLKPTFFDIAARSKWQAWANMRGKSQVEAQEIYVDLVVKSLTRSGGHPDLHQLADEILQRPPSPRSSLSPGASPNLDKDLPPIQIESPSAPYTTPSSFTPASSISSNSPHQHHARRKGSISHSIRSVTTGGMRSAAASVYELAPETLADSDMESGATGATTSNGDHQSDSGYHEITETVVEEEILNDDEYAAQLSKSVSLDNAVAAVIDRSKEVEDAAERDQHDDDDDDDDVYQSSEEYESDNDSISSESATSVASSSGKLTPSPQSSALEQRFHKRNEKQDKDDLVDEGVFEEEEKDELKAEEEGLLGSPPALDAELSPVVDAVMGHQVQEKDSEYITTDKPRISRDGSVSSGYGGSVLSDREAVSLPDIRNIALTGRDEIFSKTEGPDSPSVVPYRVHALHDTAIATPNKTQDLPFNGQGTDSIASKIPLAAQSVAKAETTPANALDGLVCPVSKKTAASGAVCPAAMFAQARAAAEAEKSGQSIGSSNEPTTPAVESANTEPTHSTSTKHQRAVTEPAWTATTTTQEGGSPPSSSLSQSAPSSAVTAATNQGKRIGQGIVSRFSALRNSLAAASARAASSALSSGSSSSLGSSSVSNTDNPNAVVVKDPLTNQSVTVVCPHLTTTHLLETEVVRLQTDISVLHERLDLLQESLKVKSQTRAQERRSARGIIKLVLRQGLINAVLLLIVFAVLYKRKSPIAFAILAYIGEGRKEGEAGWRALMRWGADMVRVGQRNQQYMLRAGRRNGYW
ncbi:hypothetical protein EC968_005727 [Mortierella alpina]|nr:hypothetical protein EC968_005727 [Mortierella alpina]